MHSISVASVAEENEYIEKTKNLSVYIDWMKNMTTVIGRKGPCLGLRFTLSSCCWGTVDKKQRHKGRGKTKNVFTAVQIAGESIPFTDGTSIYPSSTCHFSDEVSRCEDICMSKPS